MRRLTAVLVVAGSLLAACGTDADEAVDGAPTALAPGETTSTTSLPGGEEPTTTTVATDGSPGPTTVGGQPAEGGPAAPTSQPTPPPPASAGPSPETTVATRSADHLGPPGSFAGVLLRPRPAQALFFEVLVQAGARPSSGALDRIAAELSRVSGKPVTTTTGVIEEDRTSWSAADVRAAADRNAGMPQGGTGAVIRLLYLRGSSSDAEGALGVAVRGDVAAVFADEVRAAATPLIGSDAIERAVSLHEVGHLLGLVDLFLQTGRADPEHPGHSPSQGSVMYWAVESGLFADVMGDLPQDFDAADLADLATIRGG